MGYYQNYLKREKNNFRWWKTAYYSFNIGIGEKHLIEFFYNRWFAIATIKCDGKIIKKRFLLIGNASGWVDSQMEFKVGKDEIHDIIIHGEANESLFYLLYLIKFSIFQNGRIIKSFSI